MELSVLVSQVLDSGRRDEFLARLVAELSIAARVSYPSDDRDAASLIRELCAVNEAIHVVGNQLKADALPGRGGGYPTDVFAEAVLSNARGYAPDGSVRHALRRAVDSISYAGEH